MVIAVGNTRVYKFPQSSIAVDLYSNHAEVLVLPEQRKFILHEERVKLANLCEVYPERTLQNILTTIVTNALREGFLQVDEEVG